MKTSTEYRKRKHRITQDEDKQTEEIELWKLRKSSVKGFKHIYDKHTTNIVLNGEELKTILVRSGTRHSFHFYLMSYWKS